MIKNRIEAFLFLDIDGVMTPGCPPFLNTRKDYIDRENGFSDIATLYLNSLLQHFPGLGIVMTSQIRLGKEDEEIKRFFKLRGVDPERILGRTTSEIHIQAYGDTDWEVHHDVPRGVLIELWLKAWRLKTPASFPSAKNPKYLILDDSVDMLYYQKDHFVKCPNRTGFTTEALYKKAFNILRKQGVYYDTRAPRE